MCSLKFVYFPIKLKKNQNANDINMSLLDREAAQPPKNKKECSKRKNHHEQFMSGSRELVSYMKAMGLCVKLG